MQSGSLLSIVIPVGPGDETWRKLLPTLPPRQIQEVILATTTERPVDFDAVIQSLAIDPVWIQCAQGRAVQQNTGASECKGDSLLFLHADSKLSPGALPAIRRAIHQSPDTLHFFRMRFAKDGPAATRWINGPAMRFRSEYLGLPFGDQGFGMKRELFNKLGRFPQKASRGEDQRLVWIAHHSAAPVEVVACPEAFVTTSGRRYLEQGWWRTTRKHLSLTLAEALEQGKLLLCAKWRWLQ